MKLLHILPHTCLQPDNRMLGSTKDICGRLEYFHERGIDFDVFSHARNHIPLSDDLSFYDFPDYSHIIVEQTYSYSDFAYVRERWPKAKLIVRSHQSEIPHRKDYLIAEKEFENDKWAMREAQRSVQIYTDRERGAARFSDGILSIEPEESEQYWRSLGFRGGFFFAPYFLPAAYLPRLAPRSQRLNQIVCVGSSHPGPLTASIVRGFQKAVGYLGPSELADWSFPVTGHLPEGVASESPRLQNLGAVEDLFGLLCKSRAVALPSNLGRGFKTKILDAVLCGTWVLLPPELYRRLPEPVRPFCIILPSRPDGLVEAIAEMESRAWPARDPNVELRSTAYTALERALAG